MVAGLVFALHTLMSHGALVDVAPDWAWAVAQGDGDGVVGFFIVEAGVVLG
jgi:hypothetical protein